MGKDVYISSHLVGVKREEGTVRTSTEGEENS